MAARRRKAHKSKVRVRAEAPRPKRKKSAARGGGRQAKRGARAKPERSRSGRTQGRSTPQRLVAGVPVEVGVVVHYFPRAAAAVVALSRPIRLGDTIHIRGHTTDFVQQVSGLALDGAPVSHGAPAQSLGVRVVARARPGDRVYRVSW